MSRWQLITRGGAAGRFAIGRAAPGAARGAPPEESRRPVLVAPPAFRARRRGGFSLVEVLVSVAVMGTLAAVAAPRVNDWVLDNRLRATAHEVAGAFRVARAETMRTGNAHIVFMSERTVVSNAPATTPNFAGFPTSATTGRSVLAWVVDDGEFGTGDCNPVGGFDADSVGTTRLVVDDQVRDFAWGTHPSSSGGPGTAKAPTDMGGGPHTADGSSFQEQNSNGSPNPNFGGAVAFRPDGIPVAIPVTPVVPATRPCAFGQMGTGAGALYLRREGSPSRGYAVVVTPIGSVEVYRWDGASWRL